MQVSYPSLSSFRKNVTTLPSIKKERKILSHTINEYVTEVNKELMNLDKEESGSSPANGHSKFKLRKGPISKRRSTNLKSSSIFPKVLRLSSNSIKQVNQSTIIEDNKSNSTTTLPCPRRNTFQRLKLLEELKSIDEETVYVNQNLLTDMMSYDMNEKKVNKKFEKINTTNRMLTSTTDEFLQPEIVNPFAQKHANDFYSYLDQVIDRVNGSTSLDLFKKMKLLNENKENNLINFKSQKRHERVEKLLEKTYQIKKRLSKC